MKAVARILVIFVITFLVFGFLGPELFRILYTLLTGWVPASGRLVKALHPGLQVVLFFTLAVVVLVAGSHAFSRWLYMQARSPGDKTVLSRCSWKWTVCGLGILFLTLPAIGGFILTTHQIYWFTRSIDPVWVDESRNTREISWTANRLQMEAEGNQWDEDKTRAYFYQLPTMGEDRPALELMQSIWVESNAHTLRAIVLIPRRPMILDDARFMVVQPGKERAVYKLDELPEVLRSFGLGPAAEHVGGGKPY